MLQNLYQINLMIIWRESSKHSDMCVCVLGLVWVSKFTTVPGSAVHSNLHDLVKCNPINQRPNGVGQHSSEVEVIFHTIPIYKSTSCQLSTDRTSEVFSYVFLLHLLTLQNCDIMSSIFNRHPVYVAEY